MLLRNYLKNQVTAQQPNWLGVAFNLKKKMNLECYFAEDGKEMYEIVHCRRSLNRVRISYIIRHDLRGTVSYSAFSKASCEFLQYKGSIRCATAITNAEMKIVTRKRKSNGIDSTESNA